MLAGKKILVAVCGSIAAYKTAFFIRLLIKKGAEVKVIMTVSAKDFITPLTLSTLSKNPVYSSFFKNDSGEWHSHVEMGLWADAMIIAPASANTMAKMATGQCDNLLLATYLSARCPVVLSPAMDLDMYRHPATQQNIKILRDHGCEIIEAREGELASGLEGVGRMAEPEELVEHLSDYFQKKSPLNNKSFLITSGPTHEPVDAVRFIGNHSSGKMGLELAQNAASKGANVIVISGPVSTYPDHPNINVVKVQSAIEMYEATKKYHKENDVVIFAAAVSDFAPEKTFDKKRKREEGDFTIKLKENPDIARELGKVKGKNQLHIGFALETHNEKEYALKKLKEKNFDWIVLNSMQDSGAGFSHDTNKITIFDKNENSHPFDLKSKKEVANDILELVVKKYNA